MSRTNPNKPSAGSGLPPNPTPNRYGLFVRNALMITFISVLGKEVGAKSNFQDVSKNLTLEKDNKAEAVREHSDDITLDTLRKQGEVIKRIEKDFDRFKTICAIFKSDHRLNESHISFISKLMDDYQLKESKNPRDNLISILDYLERNFASYYDILIQLLTGAQILNALECKGCYEDVIKTFFDAAKFYGEKQLEVKQIKRGI